LANIRHSSIGKNQEGKNILTPYQSTDIRDELRGLATEGGLSKAAVRTVKQNLFWGFHLQPHRHTDYGWLAVSRVGVAPLTGDRKRRDEPLKRDTGDGRLETARLQSRKERIAAPSKCILRFTIRFRLKTFVPSIFATA
jgi:hypothetical protein